MVLDGSFVKSQLYCIDPNEIKERKFTHQSLKNRLGTFKVISLFLCYNYKIKD